MEEERDIPPLARVNFTEEEEKVVTDRIMQTMGLPVLRDVFPSVLIAMNSWATPAYVDNLMKEIPGPMRHLVKNYFIPDFETSIKPKRDAPLLETKPILRRKGCCGISFCFPCIL
jgi:hypothetical protein